MLTLLRYAHDLNGTWGVLLDGSKWICYTLEPVKADGARNHALKAGLYNLSLEHSHKFGRLLPTITARGRSGIRIHAGNIVSETRGCPLVGLKRTQTAVLDSQAALRVVLDVVPNHNLLKIEDYAFPN